MSSQVNNAAFYILDLFFFCGFLLGTGLAPHCTAVLRGRDSGWVAGRLCSTGMDGQGLVEEVPQQANATRSTLGKADSC